MTREKLTKKEKTEKRRIKIDDSARRLFLKKGYRFTTMDEIAHNAGYSKRTVYLDYKNKDDIFLTIATEGLEILQKRLRAVPWEEGALLSYIQAFLEVIVEFATSEEDYFKLLTRDVTPDVIARASPAARDRALKIENHGVELLSRRIESAVSDGVIPRTDSWETAEIILGSAVGIITLSDSGSQTIFSRNRVKGKVKKMGEMIYNGLMS